MAASSAGRRERMTQAMRSEEHTSELQSRVELVCRPLLEKKKTVGNACGAADTASDETDREQSAIPNKRGHDQDPDTRGKHTLQLHHAYTTTSTFPAPSIP